MGYLDEAQQAGQQLDDLLAQFGINEADNELKQTNALLAIMAAELTDRPTSYYQDGFEPTAPCVFNEGAQAPDYTSREGLTAVDSPETADWGFQADTIVLRNISDELAVAFKDPSQYEDATITVTTEDDPFVLSGVFGIRAAKMWYQQGANAAGPADFDLLTVRRRGGPP